MKLIRTGRWLALVAVGLPLLPLQAQEAAAVATPQPVSIGAATAKFSPTVNEVVKLAQSGVGDEVVTAYVKNSSVVYNLSADDILSLKTSGVSPAVVTAMLTHDTEMRARLRAALDVPRAPAPAQVAAAPTAPAAPTIPDTTTGAAPAKATPVQPVSIVEQAPPPVRVEVVPVSPGPDYYWMPGYWSWRGSWMWVGGSWGHRPWHSAVYVGGHWSRHGRGYIWVGGRWR